MTFDNTINDFDDAKAYVRDMIGSDFAKAMALAEDMIENPDKYTGIKAGAKAQLLATYRYEIGIVAQYWKNKAVGSSNRQDKLIKDCLMTAYDGLVEMINTLKLTARQEHSLAESR